MELFGCGASAGEQLISTRPFAVRKCSAWLMSNESPVSQAPNPLILKSATISYGTPCRRLLTDSTKKHYIYKHICSQYYGKSKQPCRNVCIWSRGECNGWPVSRHEPLDTTVHAKRRPVKEKRCGHFLSL